MPEVFLSYARADGETRAAKLRDRFARDAPDIIIKQDRIFLEGGVGWWTQVAEAIDSVEFLVLLVTPSALASGNVQREWRYARQRGVCVYPVRGTPDFELHFEKMPRWMSKAHFYDLRKEWPSFIAHLRAGCTRRRVPFMVPDLPPHFVPRASEFSTLKALLLTPDHKEPIAITTALAGAGGFGKTTVAAALCHDEDIIENFDDGIIWVTLGESPDVLQSLLTAYAALTGDRPGFASEEDASHQLGRVLDDRTCLLVIDDVWDSAHLNPFFRGGKSSARLFTTRNVALASKNASVLIDNMRETEAILLLTRGVAGLEAEQAGQLAHRLGKWPLALELAAAMIRERVRNGDSVKRAAQRLLQIIELKGVGTLEDPTAEERHRTISSVLGVSLQRLDDSSRARLLELSIFPEDVEIPLAAAASAWQLDEFESEALAQRFARLSLVKFDLGNAVLRLHDVTRTWLAEKLVGARDIHNRVVEAWPDWWNLTTDYSWRWLVWHLGRADRRDDIRRILWDPTWMYSKLKATDVNAVISDCEYLRPSPDGESLQDALRISAHVIATDPEQFASQMIGRLVPLVKSTAALHRFSQRLVAVAPKHWFRQLSPGLHGPGTELVRTLEGNSGDVYDVALVSDGSRAVAVYRDCLKVWDLATGRVVRRLEGHASDIAAAALTADGGRVASASWDGTLKVWDLESGEILRTLKGHSDAVRSVAITADGSRVVSASMDKTVKVWDVESGRLLNELNGHSGTVWGIAVTPDGRLAVSASGDKTLNVWNMEDGRVLHSLRGHSGLVADVAVTADGKHAVSASWDKTLILWNLETGDALLTMTVHAGQAVAVDVSADGRLAISASGEKTLEVWDLKSGRLLRRLKGHSAPINAVAVSRDGRQAVSASMDGTLKLWDLEKNRSSRQPRGHSSTVFAVSATSDGERAVSASVDRTLKVWDLKRGRVLRTLKGHTNWVSDVAITADGLQAISASWDHTLRLWDLETGLTVRTIRGHSSDVSGVALTPDGRRAVSASWDNTLKLWDINTGRLLRTLKGHLSHVNCVALAADGRTVVSGGMDDTLKVWDLEAGTIVHSLKGHSTYVADVALTPDGRRAVSASGDHTLKVWDLDSGHVTWTLQGHLDGVDGVAVTPDGRRAVSASQDKTLRLWDLETGSHLATFTLDAAVFSCAYVQGNRVIAGDSGGQIHILLLEERSQEKEEFQSE